MSPALARFFTAMHSSQWKSRYGAEFEELLADIPATPAAISDLARSAAASQRRFLVAGLFAVAFASLLSAGLLRFTVPARIAGTHVAVSAAATCAPYTSVQRRARGRCVLG